MRVWSQVSSPSRQYFKDMTISKPQSIHQYLTYLNLLLQKPNHHQNQNLPNKTQNHYQKKASQNKTQTPFLLNKASLKQQHFFPLQRQISSCQIIQVTNQDGKLQNIPIKNLLPIVNLQLLIQNQSFNPSLHLYINQNLLGSLRTQIIEKCHSIPISQLVTTPNIISMIQSKTQTQSSLQKKFKKSQKRSLLIPVNQKIYLQLVNSDVPLKQSNYQNINSPYFLNQYKQLYDFYERKIQQLLIDKELTTINLYVLIGNFLSLGQNKQRRQKYFPLVQKKYYYSFFNFLQQNKNKFWPYQTLSLKSILSLYDIFFDKTHFKLSFYFEETSQSVQKLQVKPLTRFNDNMLGKGFIEMIMQTNQNKNSQKFSFKGTIFQILIHASPQMKAYYKIPDLIPITNDTQEPPKVTLEDLIETMSRVGFKMSQISSILRNFTLVINVILLQIQEKEEKMNQITTFHLGLKDNIGFKNIRSLYAGQLSLIQSILLNQKIDIPNNQQENNSPTLIKTQILATILWQLAINRFANEINSKIQNVCKDLSKTKKFQIFCHYNSKIGQKLNQEIFIEEGTFQQTEYQIIGKKLIEKQFIIEKQSQSLDCKSLKSKESFYQRSKKDKQIDSALKFGNFILNSYLSSVDEDFTSFNSLLINRRKFSVYLYNQMKQLSQIKRIAKEIFHLNEVQDTSEKYWNEFFQSNDLNNNGKFVEQNYIFCGDHHKFIHQEKQGKCLLNFFTKLIAQLLKKNQKNNQNFSITKDNNYDDLKNLSKNNQIQKLTSFTPKNQLHNDLKLSLTSPRKFGSKANFRQSNKKKFLFIDTQNLQCVQSESQFQPEVQSSMIKTPKRMSFSIELPHLLNKYLYGQELKMIYQFLKQISPEFTNKVKVYDTLKINKIMEQSIIEISQLRNHLMEEKINNKVLSYNFNNQQLKKLQQLEFLNIFYDVYKETHYIEATQNLFFKIQQQANIQKQAVHKIITLFRSHKFKSNHSLFMFRKKFLKKIHKLCRLAKLSQKIYDLISKKNLLQIKNSFFNIKIIFSIHKLIKSSQKVFQASQNHFISSSFIKIKQYSFIVKGCKNILKVCQKLLLNPKNEAIKHLKPSPYSVMITTPTGTKKNLDVLSIDVKNVNDTSAIHSGNMSTSNLKNLLNKSDDKKSFMKKEIHIQEVEIVKEKTYKTNENQKKQTSIKSMKTEQKSNLETKNETQNLFNNQRNEAVKQTLPLNQPPLLQQKSTAKSSVPQTIEQRSQISKSKVSQLSKSKISQLNNDIVSVLNSGMSGSLVSCKSQHSQKLTKLELFTLKDSPFFSFDSWSKQTKTFHPQTQINKPSPVLFRKPQAQKTKVNQQTPLQVNQEFSLKQKIVNASFVNFLRQNVNKTQKQTVQQICYYQKKGLQKPLLKHYSIQKHGQFYNQTFNHILKISLFKNTSKKLFQLLNLLLKPIREIYRKQKSTQKTVFQDEPLVVNSYDSMYNVYRDEMFVQFAKQLMGNKDEDSLNSITFVLQIITKNYYPSPKLFYAFLNFIKTNQLSKPQLYSRVYENLIKFAQALQGYKGSHIRIYRIQHYQLAQLQYHQYLQPRQSLFVAEECKFMANKIIISLYNGQKFEFIIRNETLRTVKKRMLVELGFSRYQRNFGLYQQRRQNNYQIVSQKQKAIDYLARTAPNPSLLILRLRQYYPIKFTDINSLRMFYLNQISQQVRLPFKPQDYQHMVALAISFDEFQQMRIGNYMLMSKKEKLGDEELKGIKNKLELYTQIEGDKRICQFEYFKTIKQFNFLLTKSYKISKQSPQFMQQIDKIIVKPKQLCFYAANVMKSSLSLYRIKSFYFQNEQIHIELIYSDRDLSDGHDKKFHGTVKSLTIKDFSKISELYEDVVYYTELLQLGNNK